MIIGEQRFQCLNDTGADRTVPQKGRGSYQLGYHNRVTYHGGWEKVFVPRNGQFHNLGGAGQRQRKFRPLIFPELSVDLLGQDLLGKWMLLLPLTI